MGVLIPLLLIVALCLLFTGLAIGNQALVVACFLISLATFLLMRRARVSNSTRPRSAVPVERDLQVDDLAEDLDAPLVEPAPKTWPTTQPPVRAEARIDPESLVRAQPEPAPAPQFSSAPVAPPVPVAVPVPVPVPVAEPNLPEPVVAEPMVTEPAEAQVSEPESAETVVAEAAQPAEVVAEPEPQAAPEAAPERAAEPEPAHAAPAEDEWEPDPEDEPSMSYTVPPLVSHGAAPVWVIDGRPRYHVTSCSFLAGHPDAIDVPLMQAVEDGFTPCAVCDPDVALMAQTS